MFLFNVLLLQTAIYSWTIDTYYCPQTLPDYTISFNIVYQGTDSWYCPQTLPDYAITTGNVLSSSRATAEPGQTFTITFNTTFVRTWTWTITGVTGGDINNAALTGSFTANGQTLVVTPTHSTFKTLVLTIDGEPSISTSTELIITIPADGTVLYCTQDTSLLPNPYDPIPADGTIIYCAQDTTGLPTP